MTTSIKSIILSCCLVLAGSSLRANAQEIIVFESIDSIISWMQSEEYWGEEQHQQQLEAPHLIITSINPRWRKQAQQLEVSTKKEIFYRAMLPLVLHANKMVLDRRDRILKLKYSITHSADSSSDDLALLRRLLILLRVTDEETAEDINVSSDGVVSLIDILLYKLDVIPAGLVLGQAAYESGYGTSRFAIEGNALFGQWTYGGNGLLPEQQRKHLGDHRIASFDWPFDSVRGYFINLMSHPAYEPFRELRAKARSEGRSFDSMELADGLSGYSERGQAYVDTLKSVIRVNKLYIADNAVFRDEPIRFAIGANGEVAANQLRTEIEKMRASGELKIIIERMKLE